MANANHYDRNRYDEDRGYKSHGDESRGYKGNPEAHDIVRRGDAQKAKEAEAQRVRELAALRQQQGQAAPENEHEALKAEVAELRSELKSHQGRRRETPSTDLTIRAWYQGVGTYFRVKGWD